MRIQSFAALCLLLFAGGADWLQFRGANNSGVSTENDLPVTWTETENVAWKTPLPGRGVSSPIVVGDKVIVTSATGFKQERLHVSAYDAASGKPAWERQYWATGRTMCHPTSSVAAPSPASDGKQIYAFFSSNDLVCLDLDGNLKWYRGLTFDYPNAANDVGMSSSPLIVGDTVIVQIENQGDSFAAGIDAATGETRWRIERDPKPNWVSPVVMRGKTPADDVVLLQSLAHLTAHDPATGKQLWIHEGPGAGIPSPTVAGDVIFLPSSNLTALRRDPGSLASEILWENNKLAPGNASPIVHDGKVYILNKAGVLNCGDAKTGDQLWQLRLKGPFWATPVLAGEHLYCVNQEGIAQVVQLGEKGVLAGENKLGEPVFGSPAAANGALYVRTDDNLWKIAKH